MPTAPSLFTRPTLPVVLLALLMILAPSSQAQVADREAPEGLGPLEGAVDPPASGLEGGRVGYEMAFVAPDSLLLGRTETLAGIAYEVVGLDGLRRTRGLHVEISLLAREVPSSTTASTTGARDPEVPPTERAYRLVQRTETSSDADGAFQVRFPVTEELLVQPLLVVRIGRPGAPHRRWVMSPNMLTDLRVDFLSDRLLYEAGETLHAWVRVTEGESGRPSGHRNLLLEVVDANHHVIASHSFTTGPSGAGSVDVPLAASIPGGAVELLLHEVAREGHPVRSLGRHVVQVGVRHLERMRIAVGLDRRLLSPGDPLTGMVQVIAADSTPIAGAEVALAAGASGSDVTQTLTTDGAGQVHFSLTTASYLSGDSASYMLSATASHPAHGSATASEAYTLARTPYFLTAHPESGALAVEIESELYLQVTNALGEGAPAGLEVEVQGQAIVGGRATGTTDAHGLVRISARVPRAAVARTTGGACSGATATEIVASVRRPAGSAPAETNLCVPVALGVEVVPHVDHVVVHGGERIEVTLRRRPGARHRLLVELMSYSRPRAYAFVDPNASRVQLEIPASASGRFSVRVRPLSDDDARASIEDSGATFLSRGASTSLIVRPDDAFDLALTTDAPHYAVRDTVHVALATNVPPAERAWATVLVRDESWHAGEIDYALYSWTNDLRDMVRDPRSEHELALRYAMAATDQPDDEVRGELPVLVPAWAGDLEYSRAPTPIANLPFDPLTEREVLIRQGYATAAAGLEQLLASIPEYDPESIRGLFAPGGRVRFAEDAYERMEELGLGEAMIGLGGLALTPGDIERANIGFSFDIAAARVARARLVTLLGVLATVGSSENASVARIFSVEPPERWLALAAHHGFVEGNLLTDPWGRPFVFRDAGSRPPVIVISERAPNWELVSAGPDGRYGTSDDVRDPFARVVPEGTVYAERSGENDLIAELSRIAPGTSALTRMAAAYGELGLAASDEMVPSSVYAYASEAYDEGIRGTGYGGGGTGEGTIGLGDIGTIGHGSGSGYGSGSGSFSSRSSRTPSIRMGSAVVVAASALARVVREDFPATLLFVGEVPLDASGRASLDVRLADAVSTYRLEAIAWSESGWTSSARARVTVDQPVQIDAPIPEGARVGDRILVPIRIVNRDDAPITVLPSVTVEGEVRLTLSSLGSVVVPAQDGVALTLSIAADAVGTGAILIEAMSQEGERLDAVRRPITVRADARPLVLTRDALLEDGGALSFEVPSDVLEGGSLAGGSEVRVWLGQALFGSIANAGGDDAAIAAWASAMLHREVSPELIEQLRSRFPVDPDTGEERSIATTPGATAAIIGGLYTSAELDDAGVASLLRSLADQITAGGLTTPTSALLGLSAAVRHRDARPALAELLDEVIDGLSALSAAEGAEAVEAPETWARVAAALALVGDSADHPRVDEMLRRAERHVIRLNHQGASIAWLEPDDDDGSSVEPRAVPTSLFALALIGRGRHADAVPFLRALASMHEGASIWSVQARALAIVAMGLIAPDGPPAGGVALTFDGEELPADGDGSFALAPRALGTPGEHVIRASLPERVLAFASVRAEYLVPWERAEPRTLPVSLRWSGEVGARDTRAAMVLEVRNRSARVIARPVIDIQLPSGAELDIEARRLLMRHGTLSNTIDGVRLHLSPLRVGAEVRIVLRARWTLAGSLRGLGVTLSDERGEADRVSVLASRAVEIPEDGPEPELEPRDLLRPVSAPAPVPLPIDPLPRALAEGLR
jgi:hypothetical protein